MYIGFHAVYEPGYIEAMRYAASNGFDYVQFDLNVPTYYLDELQDNDLWDLRQVSEELGVSISFHAPADSFSLYADFPGIRDAIIEHLEMIIRKAKLLKARHLTVHTQSYPSFRKTTDAFDQFERDYGSYYCRVLRENLCRLAAVAGRELLLCVENFQWTVLGMRVLEQIVADGIPVYLAWDFAKSHGKPDTQGFMWKHADRIREVHLHDCIRGGRSHLTIGDGELDFSPFKALIQREDVAATVEVRPKEKALESKEKILGMSGIGQG